MVIEMKEHEFLLRHSQELSEKYPGRCIAIVGNRLAAVGKNRLEVYNKAKKSYPKGKVSISYIPTKKELTMLL